MQLISLRDSLYRHFFAALLQTSWNTLSSAIICPIRVKFTSVFFSVKQLSKIYSSFKFLKSAGIHEIGVGCTCKGIVLFPFTSGGMHQFTPQMGLSLIVPQKNEYQIFRIKRLAQVPTMMCVMYTFLLSFLQRTLDVRNR